MPDGISAEKEGTKPGLKTKKSKEFDILRLAFNTEFQILMV